MKRVEKIGAQAHTEIDITPMLDVVFILLIFFIITASFVKEAGINLYSPAENPFPPVATPSKPIVIKVSNLSEILVGTHRVASQNIKALITRLIAESPQSQITIHVCPKAKTKAIIGAVDGVEGAGVNQPPVTLNNDDC